MPSRLHYQVTKASPSVPWLILIHGLFGSLDNLASVTRHFNGDLNLLSLDLPDHGLSPHLSSFDYSDWVSRILEVMDGENIDSAFVLGHSLGGKVAMMTALQHPQRVTGLVVADIAPVSYPPSHQQVFKGLQGVDLTHIEKRQDADEQLAKHINEAGVRQFLLKSLFQNDQQNWRWRFNLEGLEANYSQMSQWPNPDKQYTSPTLFIKGSESDYIQDQHRAAIAKHFPTARAHIIEGTGHWLHAEKPAAFNKIVEKFVQQNQ